MTKNYIKENIIFLCKKYNISFDEFGLLFDLKKGVVSQYTRNISTPKLETIQRICKHYNITIDSFVNEILSEKTNYQYVNDPPEVYSKSSNDQKYIMSLEKNIALLEEKLKEKENKILALQKSINKKTA